MIKHIFQPHLTVPSWCGVLVNGKPCGGVKGDTVHVNAEVVDEPLKATDKQVGGDHYSKMAIQPLEYALANRMGVLEHGVLKYLSRFKSKGCAITDLDKMLHYAQMLKEEVIKHPERYGLERDETVSEVQGD